MQAILINGLSIALGGGVGLLFRRFIKKDICEAVLKGLGVTVLLLGVAGVIKTGYYIVDDALVIEGNRISSRFDLLLVISIALGIFVGEVLNIHGCFHKLGLYLERKFKKGALSEGFVNATILYCVGAMAIIGSIEAALGNPSVLYLKAVLDGVSAIILASALGFGVLFSAIPLLVYEGALAGLGLLFGNFLPGPLIDAFNIVGYALVAAIGLNFLLKEKLKVANMLPALAFAVVLYFVFK